MPLAGSNYLMFCALAVVFGITFASSFSFTPTILVQIVDLDDFTCAYGLILLTQGIGNLVGPPIAGILFDIEKTWVDLQLISLLTNLLIGECVNCSFTVGTLHSTLRELLLRSRVSCLR